MEEGEGEGRTPKGTKTELLGMEFFIVENLSELGGIIFSLVRAPRLNQTTDRFFGYVLYWFWPESNRYGFIFSRSFAKYTTVQKKGQLNSNNLSMAKTQQPYSQFVLLLHTLNHG